MLRKRRSIGDAYLVGTLTSSWSGVLLMLWGLYSSAYSPRLFLPPSTTTGHRAPTFLFVNQNHSRESLYTSEPHSVINHT